MQTGQSNSEAFGNRRQNETINIPLCNLLRCISFEPYQDKRNPLLWTSLKIKVNQEIELSIPGQLDAGYALQHQCYVSCENNSRKWTSSGEGDAYQRGILGIVESKKLGLRAIQLPNNTKKNVLGFIQIDNLLSLCTATKNPNKSTISWSITPNGEICYTRVYSYFQNHSQQIGISSKTSFFNHALSPRSSQSISSSPETEINRADLSWHKQGFQKLIIQNGADVEDLARYKNILLSLRGDIFADNHQVQIEGTKREILQKRLILLEQEIEGILKRKINFCAKGGQGARFLDYTVVLHQKEYEINELNRKIHSFESRIKYHQDKQSKFLKEIERLAEAIKTLSNPKCTPDQIKLICNSQIEVDNLKTKSLKMQERFNETNKLFSKHMESLSTRGLKGQHDLELQKCFEVNCQVLDTDFINGIFSWGHGKVIERNIQDQKTQQLLNCFAVELNRIYSKYPQVKGEADDKMLQIIQRQLCHIIGADGLSNICQIVKFIPEVVKVENVYMLNANKQRKLELYLKVLLKALLDEMGRIKLNAGIEICLDGGVIAMIHDQLGDCIDIDAILKCCSVYYKTVEVPYCIQKIVERCIEVPTVIPIQRIVQKVIYETKYQQIQKIVHVPLKCVEYCDRIVQKIVEVQVIKEIIVECPRIIEKIVEKLVQVPKIITVQVIVEKIVEKQKLVYIEKDVCHIQKEICPVQIIKQKTCVVKQTIEVIKEVEVIREVIVEKIIEKPVIIEVERCVQKLCPVVQYVYAKEIYNHIEKVPQIIERYIEKIVPVFEKMEVIKQVQVIVQKIVECKVEVLTIKEIQVCTEKIVYVDRIIEVEKVIQKPITCYEQIIKECEKVVQVPFYHERLVKCTETHEKIVPQRCQVVKIVEVQKFRDKICEVTKLCQVMVPCYKYIIQEKPVKVCIQKIVEVPTYIEKIKECRVFCDKIIEKIVEVPKIVEVQKIVEKIICVPRIVEKIVEVPKIVEVICERIIERERIVEVEKRVEVSVIVERVCEVEVIKYIECPVYKEIECFIEKIVPQIQTHEKIVTVDCLKEIIVEVSREIPKEIVIEKIVCNTIECEKIIECDKTIIIPIERPVCVDRIIQKVVVVQKFYEVPVKVEIFRQKIVEVLKEIKTVQQICHKEESIIPVIQYQQLQKIVPYITREPCAVEVFRDKIVEVCIKEERIKEVVRCEERIVKEIHCIPQVYKFPEIIEKIVEVPEYIEVKIREPIVCYDVKIVDKLVTKCIPITCIQKVIECVEVIQEKIVACQTTYEKIKEVEVTREVPVSGNEQLVVKYDTINHIETKYEQVERYEDKLVPVVSCNERIVEVPKLLEKCMERVILLPQIYEVTKHIIEIDQEVSAGLCVDVDVEVHRENYRNLFIGLRKQADVLLNELKILKRSNPSLGQRIQAIELYIRNLEKLNEFPKFVQVFKEKIVQVQKSVPIIVPRKDDQSSKLQCFLLLLIQRLIEELKNASTSGNYKCLNNDINYLFMSNQNKESEEKLRGKIRQFYKNNENSLIKKDLDNVLLTNALRDKFYASNLFEQSQSECDKYKRLADERLSCMNEYKQVSDILRARMNTLKEKMYYVVTNRNSCDLDRELDFCRRECEEMNELCSEDIKKAKILEQCYSLVHNNFSSDSQISLYQSRLRQKDAEMQLNKRNLLSRIKEPHDEYERLLADKQRVIDSLSLTLTGVFEKSKRTNTSVSDSHSQNELNLESVRQSGYQSQQYLVDSYMNKVSNGSRALIVEIEQQNPEKQHREAINRVGQQTTTLHLSNLGRQEHGLEMNVGRQEHGLETKHTGNFNKPGTKRVETQQTIHLRGGIAQSNGRNYIQMEESILPLQKLQSRNGNVEQHNRGSANVELHNRVTNSIEQHNRGANSVEQHNRGGANSVEQHNRGANNVEQHSRGSNNVELHSRVTTNSELNNRVITNSDLNNRVATNSEQHNRVTTRQETTGQQGKRISALGELDHTDYIINPHVDPFITEENRPKDRNNLPQILRPVISPRNINQQTTRTETYVSNSNGSNGAQILRTEANGSRIIETNQHIVTGRAELSGSRASQVSLKSDSIIHSQVSNQVNQGGIQQKVTRLPLKPNQKP